MRRHSATEVADAEATPGDEGAGCGRGTRVDDACCGDDAAAQALRRQLTDSATSKKQTNGENKCLAVADELLAEINTLAIASNRKTSTPENKTT